MNRFTKLDSLGAALPGDANEWTAVLDNATQLIWSADNVGDGRLDWNAAKDACATLELAGSQDWRLPTVEELFCLADRTRADPAIDVAFFPKTKSSWYWSSTPDASSSSVCAWGVNFNLGFSYYYYQNEVAFVRAVRSAPASQ